MGSGLSEGSGAEAPHLQTLEDGASVYVRLLQGGNPSMSVWRPGVTVYIDAAAIKAIDARRGPMTRSEWIRLAIGEVLAKEAGR